MRECRSQMWKVALVVLLVLTWPAAAAAQSVGDRVPSGCLLAQNSDDDPLESDDDDLLGEPLPAAQQPQVKTILLDIHPVDAEEKLAAKIYARVFQVLQQAEDLGQIYGREKLGNGQLYRHIVRTCQDIENVGCIGRFAAKTGATLAVFGEIRDMDDLLVLTLFLMDTQSHAIRESVRTPIPKPAEDAEIIEYAAQAACRLARHYGCGAPPAPVAAAVVPVPAPARPAAGPVVADEPADDAYDDEMLPDDDMSADDDEPVVAATQAPKRPLTKRQKTFRTVGWTFIGLAAAAIAGGGTTTALMYQAKDEYDSAQPGEGAKARDAKDRALMMQWTSVGLYSAAGAFAAVGIPLLVLGYQPDPETQATLLPAAGPEGFGLVFTTRF